MAIVTKAQGLISDDFRGKLGVSCGFGTAWLGSSQFGDINDRAGIYQRKKLRNKFGLSRMRSYVPTNNQLENQQIWRGVFGNGVLAWQALDLETKQAYNKLKYPSGLSGFNRFMSKYLKENQ